MDGIVFVADSLEIRRKANVLSLKDLQQNLAAQGVDVFKIPLVIQLNKRDLGEKDIPIMPVDLMTQDLNSKLAAPVLEASALKGSGVAETLKKCMVLTLQHLQKELKWTE